MPTLRERYCKSTPPTIEQAPLEQHSARRRPSQRADMRRDKAFLPLGGRQVAVIGQSVACRPRPQRLTSFQNPNHIYFARLLLHFAPLDRLTYETKEKDCHTMTEAEFLDKFLPLKTIFRFALRFRRHCRCRRYCSGPLREGLGDRRRVRSFQCEAFAMSTGKSRIRQVASLSSSIGGRK